VSRDTETELTMACNLPAAFSSLVAILLSERIGANDSMVARAE